MFFSLLGFAAKYNKTSQGFYPWLVLYGHTAASTSFNRYVYYAQAYIDTEIEKVHNKLEVY